MLVARLRPGPPRRRPSAWRGGGLEALGEGFVASHAPASSGRAQTDGQETRREVRKHGPKGRSARMGRTRPQGAAMGPVPMRGYVHAARHSRPPAVGVGRAMSGRRHPWRLTILRLSSWDRKLLASSLTWSRGVDSYRLRCFRSRPSSFSRSRASRWRAVSWAFSPRSVLRPRPRCSPRCRCTRSRALTADRCCCATGACWGSTSGGWLGPSAGSSVGERRSSCSGA